MDDVSWEVKADEKILSGLAYLLGLIPALLIWLLKKNDSSYVKFHALQAALYSGAVSLTAACMISVQIFIAGLMMAGVFIMTNLIADTLQPESPLIFLVISVLMIVSIVVGAAIMAFLLFSLKMVNLILAVSAFIGKDWRLPVLGNWILSFNNKLCAS